MGDRRIRRADKYQPYYSIYTLNKFLTKVGKVIEMNDWIDDKNFAEGNYFLNEEDAIARLNEYRVRRLAIAQSDARQRKKSISNDARRI
ncbi:MAG: hypothetical protein K1W14_06565 [Muribaculaceae bacterium]|jgi:hypothetical protein